MSVLDRLRIARMPGSSIAAPAAVGWVTDFLNAAYFARSADRDVDDLRLAFTILTTRWHQQGARLGARDVMAFHRAFGPDRLRAAPRLTLSRAALLAGGGRLLGDWFPSAVADPERVAHGVAFATPAEREAFDPSARLAFAALGEVTPPARPPTEQEWSHYPPVRLASAHAAVAFLCAPARWPDMASEGGRFTALRRGGLAGQTFEIEIVAVPAPRARLYTRGYVTATRVLTGADPALPSYLEAIAEGAGEPAVPHGARILVAVELTTHSGHLLGRGLSRLFVYEDDGGAWIRDVGSWDPLPVELRLPYALAGRAAQHAFWGPDRPEASMLVQLALASRP
jgi:hypothetical protein